MEKTSSGTELVDNVLEGGYEQDIVTTIYGPGGSGKSNLCLLATVAVARSGKKVIYIDTEGGFSIERLKQIAPDYEGFFENIMKLRLTSFSEQKKAFAELRKLVDDKIGLIIVDTVVMLYRVERGNLDKKDGFELSRELSLQISYLAEVAKKRNIPVLLTSQVYSSMTNEEVKMVGGDMLNYASKCIIELQNINGKHKLILRKHRSIPTKSVDFAIINKGIEKI